MPVKLAQKANDRKSVHPRGKRDDNGAGNSQEAHLHPLLQLSHQIGNQALQREIMKPQKDTGSLLEGMKESKDQQHEGTALVQRLRDDEQAIPVPPPIPPPVPLPGVESLSGMSLDDVRQHYGPY